MQNYLRYSLKKYKVHATPAPRPLHVRRCKTFDACIYVFTGKCYFSYSRRASFKHLVWCGQFLSSCHVVASSWPLRCGGWFLAPVMWWPLPGTCGIVVSSRNPQSDY
jgi:hypothetical protein